MQVDGTLKCDASKTMQSEHGGNLCDPRVDKLMSFKANL